MEDPIRPTALHPLGPRASRPQLASPWRSRGYLPHFDFPSLVQTITFRLADSVPAQVIAQWKAELRIQPCTIATDPAQVELRDRVARFEDSGHGACHLRDPRVAEMVEKALLHFDGERYRVLAWCVMPNHVHVVVETMGAYPLSEVIHSWKSFTSKQANQMLGRNGTFWMAEYFDRFVRNEDHLRAAIEYVHQNPVKAGLVRESTDWQFEAARISWRHKILRGCAYEKEKQVSGRGSRASRPVGPRDTLPG